MSQPRGHKEGNPCIFVPLLRRRCRVGVIQQDLTYSTFNPNQVDLGMAVRGIQRLTVEGPTLLRLEVLYHVDTCAAAL